MFCKKCGKDLGERNINFCVFCGERLNHSTQPIQNKVVAKPALPTKKVVSKPAAPPKKVVFKLLEKPFYPLLEKKNKTKDFLTSALFAIFAVLFFVTVSLNVLGLVTVDVSDFGGPLTDIYSYKSARIIDMVLFVIRDVANLFVCFSLFVVHFCARAEDGVKATCRALTMLKTALVLLLLSSFVFFGFYMYNYGVKLSLSNLSNDNWLTAEFVFYIIFEIFTMLLSFFFVIWLCNTISCAKNNLRCKEHKKRPSVMAIVVAYLLSATSLLIVLLSTIAFIFAPETGDVIYLIEGFAEFFMATVLAIALTKYRAAMSEIERINKRLVSVKVTPVEPDEQINCEGE